MILDIILTTISVITTASSIVLAISRWRIKQRLNDKEEAWSRNMEGIVNSITDMKNRIDSNEIKDVKEVRGGLSVLGNMAHSILAGIKDEIEKT